MTRPITRHAVCLCSVLTILMTVLLVSGQAAAAQTGADVAASISGPRTVRLGENITYTVTATNVGDATATGVAVSGWVPDWFNFVSLDCGSGTPTDLFVTCSYGDLAPGASVSLTLTVQACCPEPHMFELGFVSASNDTNAANDQAEIKVNFTGPRR